MRVKTTPKARQPQKAESLVVKVTEFKFDENKNAVGIVGVTFPSREKVEVALTDTGKYAENESRKSIQELRTGFKYGRDFFQLEEGGVVSYSKAYKQQDGSYKATWTDVLAYTESDAKATLAFGACLVRLYTPRGTRQTITQLRKELGPVTPPDKLAEEVEKALPLKTQRYRGVVQRFEPNHIMVANNIVDLQNPLQDFLEQPRFAPQDNGDGQTSRESMRPGFIVRSLNSEGEVVDYTDIPNYKFFDGTKSMDITEQVAHVLGEAQKLQAAELGRTIDILPFAELAISPMALQSGVGNKMVGFRKASDACHTRSEDGVIEMFAFPAALKMSMDGMWVSSIVADYSPENSIDPVLIASKGTLKPAPSLGVEEESEPQHAPMSPGEANEADRSPEAAEPYDEDADPAPRP